MIYQTSKTSTKNRESKINRQAGVTLLLAILILSSILAISFSLATVLLIEVRNSGDLLKTEPALYAATGVGEQAFYDLERHACPGNGANCYTAGFSNSVVLNGTPTIVASSTPIFTDRVKTGSTFGSTLNNYSFCDVTIGSGPCNYGLVTLTYLITNSYGNALHAYLCQFDPNGTYPTAPCSQVNDITHGIDQGYWIGPNGGTNSLNNDGSVIIYPGTNNPVSWILNPALQQQLILTNPSGANDIYVQIATFDQSGTVGKGLPYVGKTAVNVNILNAAVGRKIQVVVPNSSP